VTCWSVSDGMCTWNIEGMRPNDDDMPDDGCLLLGVTVTSTKKKRARGGMDGWTGWMNA
jgi:hypothetical protein